MPLSESAESPILARSGRGRLIQVNLPRGGVGGAQCSPLRDGVGWVVRARSKKMNTLKARPSLLDMSTMT